MPFAVVRLPGGPLKDRKVFATVGLSDHILRSKSSSKPIRQELIFIAPASFGDRSIPALLQQVGMQALEGHTALLRGEVLGPHGRLFKTGEMEALYVSIPVYLPESFAAFKRDDGETVILAWLVPVSGAEATLVKRHGWEAFEDELVKNDPDLSDPERRSLLIAAASPN
jgi:Suppressor of fused protein (SUFU)